MQSNPETTAVILGAARTVMGSFQGKLTNYTTPQLGSKAIQQALSNTGLTPAQLKSSDIETEVFMGCVLQAGLGQAPARQAALGAGLDQSTPCSTVNKVCGSGMQAAIFAIQSILSGHSGLFITGGMESMSNAPYLLDKARKGMRMGHGQIKDAMFLDGLEDAYDKSKLMGVFAENTAEKYKLSRQTQDEFALHSLEKAQNAHKNGSFKPELATFPELDQDELPTQAKPEKIPHLKPAFRENGTVTAANSSGLSDGASALIISSLSTAQKLGIKPLARILGHAGHAHDPAWFTTAPVSAIQKLCAKLGQKTSDFDLFEINEAFAVVTLAAMQELSLNPAQVNIYGGACALGHPIGASGSRIVTTLLHALKNTGKNRGIASLCIGGGEALALALEILA
ncbi:MAG: thiolase family protein [Gammaproteobacteria bacterium]